MRQSLTNSRFLRWLFKLVKYSAVFIFSFILLISLILAFLPLAVSTDWSNQFIQAQVSKSLSRPVRIEQITWSWFEGILIKKVSIPDLPEFSENSLMSLEHVTLTLNLRRLLHRELNIEFLLAGLDVNIIKTADGSLNTETLGKKDQPPPLPDGEKPPEKKEKKPFVLPLEISADIRLTGINLLYDDRAKAEKYRIRDLEIMLDASSVKTSPINLTIGLGVQVNDQIIPRSFLVASANHLFDADGELNISGLMAALNADLPGITADVRADMPASDVNGDIRVDLASVLKVAAPLIPAFPHPSDIKGTIAFNAATGTRPEDPLAFDVTLTAKDLEVSGKVFDGKSIGPGNFRIDLNGILDLNKERVTLESGNISILENSRIHISGRADQFKSDDRQIHAAVSPLYLDLTEIAAFVHPFIPSSISLDNNEKISEISLKNLQIDGQVPKGRADVVIDHLAINLPKVALKDETDGTSILQLSGTRLTLETLTATLTDLFPESAAFKISTTVDTLLKGKAPDAVSVSGIRLDHLTADAENIQKSGESKFKLSARCALDNRLSIGQIDIPDLVDIRNLTQSLNARANLRPDGTINGSMPHLDIFGEKISVLKEGVGPLETGLNIRFSLDEVLLHNSAPLNLDIKNFLANINLEDALSIALNASAADTASTSFTADVKIAADIAALTKKLPPERLKGVSGTGNLTVSLNAAGRRPDEKEVNALKNKQLRNNLDFIDHAVFGITLDNGSFEISQTGKDAIRIGSVSGHPVLSYELIGATGKGQLSTSIKAGGFGGLPAGTQETPISAEFSLSGNHVFAGSVDLNQSLAVLPSGINESVHIIIDGLDRVITKSPLPAYPMWISDVGALVTLDLNIPDCGAFREMGLPGVSDKTLNGQIDAGLNFRLVPDQSIDGNISLAVNEMNVGIPDQFSAEKIDANIDFSKSYRILKADSQAASPETSGLSKNVMLSVRDAIPFAENPDILAHFSKIHERMNPDPAISFQKADIIAAPVPVSIGESLVMLNLKNGLPSLDYFQFNLLGGTINGSVSLVKAQKKFYVNTALTFSGINTADFFPEAFSGNDQSAAEISGLLYADFPVTDLLQAMLENADIRIEFTRIGSRALERILYSLDPYESNEAIVSQRNILKAGTPRQIRLEVRNGFLSLRGEVTVKGLTFSLPAIRRLNIAQIPGMDKFRKKLSGVTPLLSILRKLSADTIVINKQTHAIAFE